MVACLVWCCLVADVNVLVDVVIAAVCVVTVDAINILLVGGGVRYF